MRPDRAGGIYFGCYRMKSRAIVASVAFFVHCALAHAQAPPPASQTSPVTPPAPAAQPTAPAPSAPGPTPAAQTSPAQAPAAQGPTPAPAPGPTPAPAAPVIAPGPPTGGQALPLPAVPASGSSESDFTVGDIRVEGLQRISEGTVYNYLPI